jgi:hypothetical protein
LTSRPLQQIFPFVGRDGVPRREAKEHCMSAAQVIDLGEFRKKRTEGQAPMMRAVATPPVVPVWVWVWVWPTPLVQP